MRVRLFSLVLAAVLLAAGAVPASASTKGEYLALGDSVAFGYNPLLVEAGLASNPNVFVGYPNTVARMLNLDLVNASCPGETSAGFISRTVSNDFACLPYVANFPLHETYLASQLDFAVNYLETHSDVKLVTMDIGANDVFKLEAACGGQATACFASGLPAVLQAIDLNLRFIYNAIRNVAGYHGMLVTLTYYSLSYDAATAAGTEALNAPIIDATTALEGSVASGFDAFEKFALAAGGSSCAAGLLIVLTPGACDVHPSKKGRDLLGRTIVRVVNAQVDD